MIVMAIIVILMSITLFPYNFYMQRSQVEKNIDSIAQEWILLHNDIKNGLLYDSNAHAHLYLDFASGSEKIDIYESTGTNSPQRLYRTLTLDTGIEIQSFSGISLGWSSHVFYHILPPYGKGLFSTGTSAEVAFTGVILRIGYPGASLESGRAREILLRPYY